MLVQVQREVESGRGSVEVLRDLEIGPSDSSSNDSLVASASCALFEVFRGSGRNHVKIMGESTAQVDASNLSRSSLMPLNISVYPKV